MEKKYIPTDDDLVFMLKETLKRQADQLTKLSQTLSDKGQELDNGEKRDIRHGVMCWVDDMHDEAAYFFSRGYFGDYESNRKEVSRVLEILS